MPATQGPETASADQAMPTPSGWSLRREAAKRLHPDLGGDPEEFVRVMQAFAAFPVPATAVSVSPASPGGVHLSPARSPVRGTVTMKPTTVLARWRREHRRRMRAARARLPRAVPGARRYGQL